MNPSGILSNGLSALNYDCLSDFLIIIGVDLSILNCCVTFLVLKELPFFGCFGVSDGLMYWVLVSEKFRSQQDSNLWRKTPSDF